jgi:hypothetical protein
MQAGKASMRTIPTPFPYHPSDDDEAQGRLCCRCLYRELREELDRAFALEGLSSLQGPPFLFRSAENLRGLREWLHCVLDFLIHLLRVLRGEPCPGSYVEEAWLCGLESIVSRDRLEEEMPRNIHAFIVAVPQILYAHVAVMRNVPFCDKRELFCALAFTAASLLFHHALPFLSRDDLLHERHDALEPFPYSVAYVRRRWYARLSCFVEMSLAPLKGAPDEYFWLFLLKDALRAFQRPIAALEDHRRFFRLYRSLSALTEA